MNIIGKIYDMLVSLVSGLWDEPVHREELDNQMIM